MTISTTDFPKVAALAYQDARQIIRSGDILLCSNHSLFANLIQRATQSVWDHVALILRLPEIDRIMVIESAEHIGVRIVPLSGYINNYNGSGKHYPGKLLIARHRLLDPASIPRLTNFAIDFLGYPYSLEACLRIAMRHMLNLGFYKYADPIQSDRAFICSEYVYRCFQSIGLMIDYNANGFISPADFAKSRSIEAINFIQFH